MELVTWIKMNEIQENSERWVSGQATHGDLVNPINLIPLRGCINWPIHMSGATHHQSGGGGWKPALTTKWVGEWGEGGVQHFTMKCNHAEGCV